MNVISAASVVTAAGGAGETVRIETDRGSWFMRVVDGVPQSGGLVAAALVEWLALGNSITPAGEP